MTKHPGLALFLFSVCVVGLGFPQWITPISLIMRGITMVIMIATAVGMSNAELRPAPRFGLVMTAVGTAFIGTGLVDPNSPVDDLGQIIGVSGFTLFMVCVFGPPMWFWAAHRVRRLTGRA